MLGPFKPGKRLAIVGDSGRIDNLEEYCRGVNTLVIESTYLDAETEMAYQFSHLTARMAAELAQRAGVGQLILTHVSRRYSDRDILSEAGSVFGNVQVAKDFDIFKVMD